MKEIWKDIDGYEGLYQVSNLGNVRSLNWGRRGIIRNLYLKKHNKGYLHVELANDGAKKAFTVHRLVAMAFIPNPNNYGFVNHIDEDKTNNNAENLEWCAQSQNMKHTIGLHPEKYRVIGKPYIRKEKVVQMSKSGEVLKVWDSLVSIRHTHGWNEWSIGEVCRGKRKTAYGYIWCYAS